MELDEHDATLHGMLHKACRDFPHYTAAIFDDGSHDIEMVTYKAVMEAAHRVATTLNSCCDSCQGKIIGLYVEPAIHLPSWIFGILQVEAAFASIEPREPSILIEYFIRKLNISILFVQSSLFKKFINGLGQHFQWVPCPEVDQTLLSCLGIIPVRLEDISPADRVGGLAPSTNLAYALHTSGTTGRPKIVRVPHCCITPNIVHIRDLFSITQDDVVFMASPLTFDPSIVEMFMTWSRGATLLMVPSKVKMAPRTLARVLMSNHVTVLQVTPSLVTRFPLCFLNGGLLAHFSPLRLLALGGETCPAPSTLATWRGRGNATEFHNLYGITEVSSWASCFQIPEDWIKEQLHESVPLGDPLKHTILQVKDNDGRVITSGRGELFIGSDKRVCYLDEEEPRSTGQLVMRATGDIVEITDRGLVFVGRHDDQVKRHGKRMSLSNIKLAIESCNDVKSCMVFLMNEKLIAVFTSTTGHSKSDQSSDGSEAQKDHTLSDSQSMRNRLSLSTEIVSFEEFDPGLHFEDSSASMYGTTTPVPTASPVGVGACTMTSCSRRASSRPSSAITDSTRATNRAAMKPTTVMPVRGGACIVSGSLAEMQVFNEARESLPHHALPDMFVEVAEFPITLHGKVDIPALREVVRKLQEEDVEEKVRENTNSLRNWKDILACEWKNCLCLQPSTEIGNRDSFIALGGDSFQALHLVRALEQAYLVPLPHLMDVLLHQTFEHVCTTLQQHLTADGKPQDHMTRVGQDRSQIDVIPGKSKHDEELQFNLGEKFPLTGHKVDLHSTWEDVESTELVKNDFANHEQQQFGPSSSCTSCPRKLTSPIQHLDVIESPPICSRKRKPENKCPRQAECDKRIRMEVSTIEKLDSSECSTTVHNRTSRLKECVLSLGRASRVACHRHICQDGVKPSRCRLFEDGRDLRPPSASGACGLHLEETWRVNTGKCVDASPLVVSTGSGTTVFIGSHSHKFVAISMETGGIVWEVLLGGRIESSACLSTCGTYVVVGCYDNHVYCLCASSGTVVWTYRTSDIVKCSPVCDHTSGLVYIGSHDQHVVALDIKARVCRWRAHCGGGSVFASPCIHHPNAALYVATLKGSLLALDKASGQKKWSIVCSKPIFSSPAVTRDGVIVASVDGIICCISHSGVQLWTHQLAGPAFSSPCVSRTATSCLAETCPQGQQQCQLVVVGSHSGHVTCLDPSTGKALWTHRVSVAPVYSTAFIFAHNNRRRVATADTDGRVYILDLPSGRKEAEIAFPGEVFSSPVVEGNHLVVGCRNDFVYCLALKD